MSENRKTAGLNLTDVAALALLAVQASAAFLIYVHGPTGPIPVHFDLHGQPNGWGDRHALAIGVAVLAGVTGLIYLMLRLSLFTGAFANAARTHAVARELILAVAALITALLASLAFARGGGQDQQRLHLMIPWLIIVVVGALVGKAAPNAFVGVRVYWTFRSRLAWDKANRLLGRIFFFGGLIGVLALPFIDLSAGATVAADRIGLMIVVIGGSTLAIIESWRVWRTDPERIP